MTLTLVLLVVFLGALGQSIFGFGGGLIAIPLLSLLVGVQDGVTLALVLQLATSLLIFKQREHLDWKRLKQFVFSLIAATTVGTYLLAGASENSLRLFLAGFIVVYLVQSTFFAHWSAPGVGDRAKAIGLGVIAGFFQGFIGSGGPAMIIYLRAMQMNNSQVRANLLFLLLISNCVRLPLSLSLELFHWEVVMTSLAAIPCFLLAMYTGQRIHTQMNEKQYRVAIDLLLIVCAVSLILK